MRILTHLLVLSIVFYGFHVSTVGAAPKPIPTSIPSITEGGHGTNVNGPSGNSDGFVERGSNSNGSSNNMSAGGKNDSGLISEGVKFTENIGRAAVSGLGQGASSIAKGSADTVLRLTQLVATPITSSLRVIALPFSIPLQAVEVMLDPFIVILKAIFRTLMGTWSEYNRLSGNVNGDENKGITSRSKRSIVSDVESSVEPLVSAPFDLAGQVFNVLETAISGSIWEATKLAVSLFWNFFLEILLPTVHDVLDASMRANLLPEQWRPVVQAFDTVYSVLQVLGYVS